MNKYSKILHQLYVKTVLEIRVLNREILVHRNRDILNIEQESTISSFDNTKSKTVLSEKEEEIYKKLLKLDVINTYLNFLSNAYEYKSNLLTGNIFNSSYFSKN